MEIAKIEAWLQSDNNRQTLAELEAYGLECPYVCIEGDDRTADTICQYADNCTVTCALNKATKI